MERGLEKLLKNIRSMLYETKKYSNHAVCLNIHVA